MRLNTNGASKRNPSKGVAGGIIRGQRGEVFELFASNYGTCSCTKAELWVVLRSLAITCNGRCMGITQVY